MNDCGQIFPRHQFLAFNSWAFCLHVCLECSGYFHCSKLISPARSDSAAPRDSFGDLDERSLGFISPTSCVSDTELRCTKSDGCFAKTEQCDRWVNCLDNSDETDCSCKQYLPLGWWRTSFNVSSCSSGKCSSMVEESLKEEHLDWCGFISRSRKENLFLPRHVGEHLNKHERYEAISCLFPVPEKICDGYPDCPLGEDENSCPCAGDSVQCGFLTNTTFPKCVQVIGLFSIPFLGSVAGYLVRPNGCRRHFLDLWRKDARVLPVLISLCCQSREDFIIFECLGYTCKELCFWFGITGLIWTEQTKSRLWVSVSKRKMSLGVIFFPTMKFAFS